MQAQDMPDGDLTALDQAHGAMESAPEDDAARLRFYERLADSELFLLLLRDAEGEAVEPDLFAVEGEQFALVFDREERLATFVGRPAPYAALSGRALTRMLAGQDIGLALNPDVAPSAMLLPADAIDWLAATLAHAPTEAEARPREVLPPHGLPEALLTGLDRKLAIIGGLAQAAYLVGVIYDDGARGHLLAFVGAVADARPALAAAAAEALTFSGVEAGAMDVTFVAPSDPFAARLAKVGLRFDLPQLAARPEPAAPGMDPDKPPRLR
jgi:hypothetical protein